MTLARKALADTTVRAPFAGWSRSAMVSTGDYVTRGTRSPRSSASRRSASAHGAEQFVASVSVGQPVSFTVDAFPGRTFEGKVRFVSPALRAEQRALTVEAVVPNANADLKPGMFATARIEQNKREPAVLVPEPAVRVVSGTGRVFVVNGDRAEERIVTTGQKVDSLVEIVTGLKSGERVATQNVTQLIDGTKVR